ncbi:hypothetical protein KZO25_11855 [Halomonas sp. ANAO-440]|uniref:hypothetical protein n=1 Tax=Halomonas sp. ANAO-440 TaxID=2861360 RepID=UPI001CAA7793|nr:hypothetical protein [Halomonas sp. ANAO-440]MBZ0331010.1 hypothetical protein [Halomonas sp. ANAO-440]
MGLPAGILMVWATATLGAISNHYWLSVLAGLLCLGISLWALYCSKVSQALLLLGLTGAGLAWVQQDVSLILGGLRSAATFVAFLASLYVLRGIIQTSPALSTVQSGLDGLPHRSQYGTMQLLGFTFAVPLAVGAVGVIGPLVTRITEEASREISAAWALRGMGLAVFFSPFTVAMGTVMNALGERLALPLLLATGFITASICLTLPFMLGHCHFPTQLSRHFWQQTLRVFQPILLLVGAVLGLTYASHLSALESIALSVPVLSFIIMAIRGPQAGRKIFETAKNGWQNMSGEVTIFVAAMLFATALSSHPAVTEFFTQVADKVGPGLLITLTVLGVASMAMAGVHMLVTTTIFLTAFEPHMPGSVHLVMLGMAGLIGWGFGSMVAPGSPAFLLATRIFMVRRQRMAFGMNMRFMLTIILLLCLLSNLV